MSNVKTAVGVMPCQCCGKEVVVKSNERGTLSYACQWCDDAPYQRAGTLAYKAWQGKTKPLPGAAPVESTAPLNTEEKPTAATPEKKKSNTMFD